MSPAHTLRVADHLFLLFFTAAGGTGAPATRTDSPSVAVVGGPGARRGARAPDEPDPSAMERRDQKHNQQHTPPSSPTTQTRSPPKPNTTPAMPATPPPTPHRPNPPHIRVAGLKPNSQAKTQAKDRTTDGHEHDAPYDTNTTGLRHPKATERNRLTPGNCAVAPLSPLVGMVVC
jgi:hypothetical protein